MQNADIRLLMSDRGLRYRDLAQVMGVRADSLSRLLSGSLSKRKRAEILTAIDTLEERRKT